MFETADPFSKLFKNRQRPVFKDPRIERKSKIVGQSVTKLMQLMQSG